MAIKQVYLLEGGYLYLDRSILLWGRGYGQEQKIPACMALLETDKGWVLIDTGLNPLGVTEPEKAWGERAKVVKPELKPEDDVRFRLKELGLTAGDIRYVIHTHMHWDHTGGNRFFTEAAFLVQKAEYRFAYWPDQHVQASYMRDHFDCGVHYELVEGDTEVLPDITLVHTPGHTPGHQSVLVKVAGGKYLLFAGDAAYTLDNVAEMLPLGNSWDPLAAVSSLRKLKTIQILTGALLLPSHDLKFWAGMPKSPTSLI
jgi:N-acyl homoserine lactone hydrolase